MENNIESNAVSAPSSPTPHGQAASSSEQAQVTLTPEVMEAIRLLAGIDPEKLQTQLSNSEPVEKKDEEATSETVEEKTKSPAALGKKLLDRLKSRSKDAEDAAQEPSEKEEAETEEGGPEKPDFDVDAFVHSSDEDWERPEPPSAPDGDVLDKEALTSLAWNSP